MTDLLILANLIVEWTTKKPDLDVLTFVSIDDVFVYGVPIKDGAPGEKNVVAAIVPVDRSTFDAGQVFAQCQKILERNFVPSYLHLVDAIPKTASEKPQERFLLDAFDPEADFVLSESIGETQ